MLNIQKPHLQLGKNVHKIYIYANDECTLMVGRNKDKSRYHAIKFYKSAILFQPQELVTPYTQSSMTQFLNTFFNTTNARATHLKLKAYGLLGIFQLMRGFYLYLITEREAVAKYLGSVIYEIKGTKTYQLFSECKKEKKKDFEKKYLDLFLSFKLTGGFYFSYDFDLSCNLSQNLVSKESLVQGSNLSKNDFKTMNLKPGVIETEINSSFIDSPVEEGLSKQMSKDDMSPGMVQDEQEEEIKREYEIASTLRSTKGPLFAQFDRQSAETSETVEDQPRCNTQSLYIKDQLHPEIYFSDRPGGPELDEFDVNFLLDIGAQRKRSMKNPKKLGKRLLKHVNERFLWNSEYQKFLWQVKSREWFLPVIHGYIEQKVFQISSCKFSFLLISRRSRHFAGRRYLRRGVNMNGDCANQVETEQIVFELKDLQNIQIRATSYVHLRGSIPFVWSNAINDVFTPKPKIIYNHMLNEGFRPTIRHFNNLMMRYGSPIEVIDLVKQREKRPRETILGQVYQQFCSRINSKTSEQELNEKLKWMQMLELQEQDEKGKRKLGQRSLSIEQPVCAISLENRVLSIVDEKESPKKKKRKKSLKIFPNVFKKDEVQLQTIQSDHDGESRGSLSTQTQMEFDLNSDLHYTAFDFSHRLKEDDSKMIIDFQEIANDVVRKTSFFYYLTGKRGIELNFQSGVARVNCIDCLDRTNYGMAIIGGVALAKQLQILLKDKGFDLDDFQTFMNFSTGSVGWQLLKLVFDVYNNNGDKIATQYTGTKALHGANIVQNRKGEYDIKKKGGTLIAVRRYFGNLYNDIDIQKQMLLYLGQFRPRQELKNIWELDLTKKLNSMRACFNPRTNFLKRWRGSFIFEQKPKTTDQQQQLHLLPSYKELKDDLVQLGFSIKPTVAILPLRSKCHDTVGLIKRGATRRKEEEKVHMKGPFSCPAAHQKVCEMLQVAPLKEGDYREMEYIGNYQANSVLGLYSSKKGKQEKKVHIVRGLKYPDGPFLEDLVEEECSAKRKNGELEEEKKLLFSSYT